MTMFDHDWNLGCREPCNRLVCSIKIGSALGKIADYTPIVSNVKGAVQGNVAQAIGGPVAAGYQDVKDGDLSVRGVTNALGVTSPNPEDVSKGPDAEAARQFATKLRDQYSNLTPGQVAPIQATTLDQTQANQARGIAAGNLGALQGVASGATPTAADALLTRGTDEGARAATGLAAAYSRGNPGLALRAGLAGSENIYAKAAATAAEQKANEQAAARAQIGQLADAMRNADLSAASFNAGAANNVSAANQKAALEQQQINNQQQLGLGNLAANATTTPLSAAQANEKLQFEANKANQEATGSLWTGAGKALTALSDKRAKERIRTSKLADALGKEVRGVTFEYKAESGEAPGKHAGVIADDLERVVPGVVTRGKDGMRVVDTGHLSLANTGIIAELAKRLKKVENRP